MPNAGFGPSLQDSLQQWRLPGNLPWWPYIVLKATEPGPYLQQAGVYLRQATGRRYHERNARQSAEARATCHLGGWNCIGAKPTAGPRPRKVDAAFRTDPSGPAKACRTEGHG